ncbi:MAG: aminotransferase class I/II-fold pyridoxal phosphate-dependent enzyme [Alphaproteobacteria bacterium]
MDLFDKFAALAGARNSLLAVGANPFDVRMERVRSATEAVIEGRDVILFGTNNYLGLTFDPVCMAAAQEAVTAEGTGTTGSRIANGNYAAHQDLEAAIAGFLKRRAAMVFSTGYQANLGTIAGLAGPDDILLIDADSHASIYDGCRLSGATIGRFRHNDPSDLDKRLGRLENGGNVLVVVEGLYSMLGDCAPLAEFAEVKTRHGAYLMVDEAHSVGVYGENGRGNAEDEGVEDAVDFVVGTFSKSLGAIGGFAASNHPDFELLRLASRPYMFTASPSPSNVASVKAALGLIEASDVHRKALWRNARALHQGISDLGFSICAGLGPIIAIRFDDTEQAFGAWRGLLDGGIYTNLAIPPGTPNGISMLRCSVSAAHSEAQVEAIIGAFSQLAGNLGSETKRNAEATSAPA